MVPALVLIALLLSQGEPVASNVERDLLQAAKTGQLARVHDLLARGADPNTMDWRGFTPLMWAAASGNGAVIAELLDRGASTTRRTSDGTTALMLASANGFTDIVRVFVARGADVGAAGGGVTPRQRALERGFPATAAVLEQAEGLGVRLLRATAEGHDALVRQLISLGAPINVTDERGATPLMIAARNGDLGIVQTLLTRGADASHRDLQGLSVFDWAEPAPTGKYVVAFLVDRGVSRTVPRARAPAPAPEVKVSLRTLARALALIRPPNNAIRLPLRRATAALSRLQALSDSWPANSPDDYRDNLAADVSALRGALAKGDLQAMTATIQALADDLDAKLEHCTRSGGKLGGSVVVHVRTLRGSEEVKNWQVLYMPRIFEAATNASPDLFPQISSPTEETIVPGRYVMWVRDPATTRVGERTIVKVGEGRKELTLDLPVPAAPSR